MNACGDTSSAVRRPAQEPTEANVNRSRVGRRRNPIGSTRGGYLVRDPFGKLVNILAHR